MRKNTLLFVMICGLAGSAAAQQRFDLKVRDDFFAGFTGDNASLNRAMKACEDALRIDAGNAQALVWHGSGLFFESGQAFRAGDSERGMDLYQRGLKEMESAVAMAPDDVAVRVPLDLGLGASYDEHVGDIRTFLQRLVHGRLDRHW